MTLLDFFSDYEEKYGSGDIHKFKKVFDAVTPSKDYIQLKFELKTIFSFIDALEPKSLTIDIDERLREIKDLEFNPTIRNPNIHLTDKLGREFCVWYKPLFFYPYTDSVKPLLLDFVVAKGEYKNLYNLDAELEKVLFTEKFFPESALKNISIKLLSKLRPLHAVMFVRKKFMPSDMTEIKSASYFLKPNKTLLISEEYLPQPLKMTLPISAYVIENLDMNSEKFKESVKKII